MPLPKCFHKILGIKWNDFMSHEEVTERFKQLSISATLWKWCLHWLGHVLRQPLEHLQTKTSIGCQCVREREDNQEWTGDREWQEFPYSQQAMEQHQKTGQEQHTVECLDCLMCNMTQEHIRMPNILDVADDILIASFDEWCKDHNKTLEKYYGYAGRHTWNLKKINVYLGIWSPPLVR